MEYSVDKEKCIGCGSCNLACPSGMGMANDGKATVISASEVEGCGGVDLCPYGAIIEEDKEK
ncbi:MAG: ferredoxin [Candidatus Paceibacterota bacterium]